MSGRTPLMRVLDLRGQVFEGRELHDALPRAAMDIEAVVEVVRPIVEDVRVRGAAAVRDLSERYDGVRPGELRVAHAEIDSAVRGLDPQVRAALEVSIARARTVHAAQRRGDTVVDVASGGRVTERWVPVRRVGLYVPGGLAVYPSSVVMNVVPAQEAGVEEMAVISPPQQEFGGGPHPLVLAACGLLGITEVYAAGGAQGVAMLAHGARESDGPRQGEVVCAPVDMVTGPGNAYVTAAKRLLKGLIGIDSEAGVTEIAIVADDTADAVHVAADLISQAEHHPDAASVLITASESLAEAVLVALDDLVAATKHSERVTTALAGPQSAVVLVEGLDAAMAVADAYAAEHLEIHTEDARERAMRVRNAGAVFVGTYSPVSLGDYCAGSNHVLPTGGCACHSSGLSVQTFLRGIHVVDYSREALAEVAGHVVALANAEDLPAHGEAVTVRFER